jgi:phosphate transport system substrate-binding protein
LGKIRKWNDPAIVTLNPGAAKLDDPIMVNYRPHGSGTTFTFTDYLTKVSTEWANRVGRGKLTLWPVGIASTGNEGVADAVKSQPGAIGYVELSYATTKGIPYALLQNRADEWVDADTQTISAAALNLASQLLEDLQQSITDAQGLRTTRSALTATCCSSSSKPIQRR